MVFGFVMFWVACIFVINTAAAFGRVDSKETGPWNIVVGSLVIFVVAVGVVKDLFNPVTFWWAAQVLLFGMTYLMLGINTVRGTDGRGLGWYCLFVALSVPFPAYQTFAVGDYRVGVIWVLWGILWFMFFIMLGLQKTRIAKFVNWFQIFITIFTLWLPGVLMMMELW